MYPTTVKLTEEIKNCKSCKDFITVQYRTVPVFDLKKKKGMSSDKGSSDNRFYIGSIFNGNLCSNYIFFRKRQRIPWFLQFLSFFCWNILELVRYRTYVERFLFSFMSTYVRTYPDKLWLDMLLDGPKNERVQLPSSVPFATFLLPLFLFCMFDFNGYKYSGMFSCESLP